MLESLRLFIWLSRPLFLVGVAVVYALGVGIAHYLGGQINWQAYVLGQIWVALLQLSAQYLNEYYDFLADQANPQRTFLTGGSGALGPGKLSPQVALWSALASLAFLASLTVIVIAQVSPSPQVYFIMALAFLAALFYSMPPLRLEASGYGELTTSFLVAFLVLAYAFILQAGEFHRLVAMTAFPVFTAHMAMLLALEFPDYGTDLKFEKGTLLVRLGWQTSLVLHDVFVLSTFLALLLVNWYGYPWFATLAGLLSLPLGLLQIWQMHSIAAGAKPNWNLLVVGGVAFFTSLTYLLAFSFWTH